MALGNAIQEFLRALATEWPPGGRVLGRWFAPTAAGLIAALRDAGAVSPSTAQRFHPHSKAEEEAFLRLMRRRVIRQVTPGHYYLDARILEEPRRWIVDAD